MTKKIIEALRAEALEAGDCDTVRDCDILLGARRRSDAAVVAAASRIAQVLSDAAAMRD